MNLSIIIPVFNEEKNILKLYKKLKKIFYNKSIQIIFVNDNSYDSSGIILDKIVKKDNQVIHYLRKKRDLTQSCIDGFYHQNIKIFLLWIATFNIIQKI